MGIHPDLLDEVSPWTTVSHKKDRKSTRLNSSHSQTSYAVFCFKNKTQNSDFFHRRPRLSQRSVEAPDYTVPLDPSVSVDEHHPSILIYASAARVVTTLSCELDP